MQFSHTSGTRHYLLPKVIKLLVAKLVGRSPFLGTRNDNVWCGPWDTRR
jgi:beta-N-acetylhexosaminidase